MNQLLTVKEAAETLRVCDRTIRSLITNGRLPSAKLGRFRYVRQNDLDAYVESLFAKDRKTKSE
jgi:excisionase family DNA binding protein